MAATQLELNQVPDFENLWSFQDDQLRLLLTEMEREVTSDSATGPLYGDLLGLSLSVALIRKYGRASATPAYRKGGIARPALNRVLDYIAANLRSEILIGRACRCGGSECLSLCPCLSRECRYYATPVRSGTPHRYGQDASSESRLES
jgi:AraC family transcriptional regulator